MYQPIRAKSLVVAIIQWSPPSVQKIVLKNHTDHVGLKTDNSTNSSLMTAVKTATLNGDIVMNE